MRTFDKRLIVISTAVLVGFSFAGCKPKGARALIRQAEREHGPCEVISQEEGEDGASVVLLDELQGFEYEVSSGWTDINIDGSNFGSLPDVSDGFDRSLSRYVWDEAGDEIEAVLEDYGLVPDSPLSTDVPYRFEFGDGVSEDRAVDGLLKIAEIVQEYNLEHRLDGWEFSLEHDNAWIQARYDELIAEGADPDLDYVFSSSGGAELAHIGSVRLPDISFRDQDQEHEDYFLEQAQYMNRDAELVRVEQRTFADTGLSFDVVSQPYYQYYPQSMDDPVVFYYFEADGEEFFICNFLVTPDDGSTERWYTNYRER